MADDPQQESAPSNPDSTSQAGNPLHSIPPAQESAPSNPDSTSQAGNSLHSIPPAQESFGPPFPEASTPYASAVPFPSGQSAQPGQAPFSPFQAQPGYGYAIPPQGLYGPPPYGFRAPLSAPLPLGEAIRQLPGQYWRVLTHPKAATFVEEQGKAAWNIIWVQLLILSVVQALAILLLVFLEFFFFRLMLPSSSLPSFSQIFSTVAVVLVLVYIALALISFFICTGIFHLIAKAFGGQGKFLPYAYCYSLVVMPISILTILLSIIPCIGSLASSAGGVYEIVLLIFMTMGIQRLSGGKATATILIPVGAVILLIAAIYVAYFVFFFSLASSLPHG